MEKDTPMQLDKARYLSSFAVILVFALLIGSQGSDTIASGDTISICHKPDDASARKTMTIPYNALNAHLAHGDYIGNCESLPDDKLNDNGGSEVDPCNEGKKHPGY
jgi:hypothetical protein